LEELHPRNNAVEGGQTLEKQEQERQELERREQERREQERQDLEKREQKLKRQRPKKQRQEGRDQEEKPNNNKPNELRPEKSTIGDYSESSWRRYINGRLREQAHEREEWQRPQNPTMEGERG